MLIMLVFLDVILTVVHLAIIGFNLFGWIWPATRRAHLAGIVLTAVSWFLLGIWFGIGYCPFTDWQWAVKKELGEQSLPQSFVKYYADKLTQTSFSPEVIDRITLLCFGTAAVLSVYFNFFRKRKRGNKGPSLINTN